jgi:outer membrane protein TolC
MALSLPEALKAAEARHPALLAARADALAGEADADAARAAGRPRLVAEGGAHVTDNQVLAFSDKLTAGTFSAEDFLLDRLNNPDPIDHATASVTVELPLYTSGRITAQREAMAARAASGKAQQEASATAVRLLVVQAYHGVHVARAARDVAVSALADARGHEAVAGARVEAGAALRSDLLRAQVERLSRQQELARREADLGLAFARLRRLVGDEGDHPIDLTTPLEAPAAPPGPLEAWLEEAESRPDLRALREEAEAAGRAAAAERSRRGPEVTGMARYEGHAEGLDAGRGNYLAGVSLRWTLFDPSVRPHIAAAAFRETAARARLDDALAEARLEIRAAHADALVADEALHAAREAVVAAQTARRITADRYEEGMLPITDLLDVESALVRARLEEAQSLYEVVVSRARLARASGRPEMMP